MTKLQRLLRVAAARNKAHEYMTLKVRFLRSTRDQLRQRCTEDGISMTALIEALARGFINKHPAALAMVDQWVRDEGLDIQPAKAASLSRKDLDEVYAAIGDNELTEE